MKFSQASNLLALAGLSSAQELTCGTTSYPLQDGATTIGQFDVIDGADDWLEIEVDITGNNLASEVTGALAYITEIRIQTCCDTDCSPWLTHTYTEADNLQVVDGLMVNQGLCGTLDFTAGENLGATDIKVFVDIEKPGGIDAFNAAFPSGGMPVEFSVSVDAGSDVGASYLDLTFHTGAGHPLDGLQFDAYCIDIGHGIGPGTTYTNGLVYSFLDPNIDWETVNLGNIDNPQNMDAVAWCVNHWQPGQEYTTDDLGTYTLSSGTMQRAIWYIVDNTQSTAGLGPHDDAWAQHIRDDCLANGNGFVPGCNDDVPIVLTNVPGTTPNFQNLFITTTFAGLGIQCNSASDEGEAEAFCVMGANGWSGGDPHFKTWGNSWFDFHGGCDLVLADFPSFANGLGLTAHVRTTIRYGYSYIESAAIKIGDAILQVSSLGNYMLDGVADARLPKMLAGYVVEHTIISKTEHHFTIHLGDKRSIFIKVFKDLVYVDLNVRHGHSVEFHDGVGILGSYFNGTRFARDGVTIVEDENEYGQEWQVLDTDPKLFDTDRAPQWPAKCEMPNANESTIRRLGEGAISIDEATAACDHIKDQQRHDMCVFDVMATADLSVAQAGPF